VTRRCIDCFCSLRRALFAARPTKPVGLAWRRLHASGCRRLQLGDIGDRAAIDPCTCTCLCFLLFVLIVVYGSPVVSAAAPSSSWQQSLAAAATYSGDHRGSSGSARPWHNFRTVAAATGERDEIIVVGCNCKLLHFCLVSAYLLNYRHLYCGVIVERRCATWRRELM